MKPNKNGKMKLFRREKKFQKHAKELIREGKQKKLQ